MKLQARDEIHATTLAVSLPALAFGLSYRSLIPEAPWFAAVLVALAALLACTRSAIAGLAMLAAAVGGVVCAVQWTLEGRFAGGHIVLMALFVTWAAQRGLGAAIDLKRP